MDVLTPMQEEWKALEAQRTEKEAAVAKLEEGLRKVVEDRDRKREEAASKQEAQEKRKALEAAQARLEEMKYAYEAIQQTKKYQQNLLDRTEDEGQRAEIEQILKDLTK
jgi:hypothetical protein